MVALQFSFTLGAGVLSLMMGGVTCGSVVIFLGLLIFDKDGSGSWGCRFRCSKVAKVVRAFLVASPNFKKGRCCF